MASLYDRKFTIGKHSELIMNEELHKTFESIRHLTDRPENANDYPNAVLNGSFWHNIRTNELKYYDKSKDRWINVFNDKFRITGEMLTTLPPENPVYQQFWINNGILMYFDGVNWQPIKAVLQDSSQLNMSVFENFIFLNPLLSNSNAVVDDEAIENWKRFVLEGKLDWENNSQFVHSDDKWNPAWECPVHPPDDPQWPIPPEQKTQFLVPNIDYDRFFVDRLLIDDYEEINKICIQYASNKLYGKPQSLIHVNPGKITEIKKRLIKIDRDNPTIEISQYNTEFYGFRNDSVFGKLLLPESNNEEGDYATNGEGSIILKHNASQTYDYVLAITYTFSWMKSTGKMRVSSNKDIGASYYIANWGTPINVFIDGYDLEGDQFELDGASKIITINQNITGMELSLLRTCQHEYGFIRTLDIQNRGIIKLHKKFIDPLVFVNGEVVHPTLGDIEIADNKIYVKNAQKNMSWCVIEMTDLNQNDEMYHSSGLISEKINDTPIIRYDNTQITDSHNFVVFIDGLILNKDDIVRNSSEGYITAQGLHIGQEYILLKDADNRLYNEDDLSPALSTGNVSESLVYMNGLLLMNDTAFVTVQNKDDAAINASQGEIKFFLANDYDMLTGEWCVYNSYLSKWETLELKDIESIREIGYSYENTIKAVRLKISTTDDDVVTIYTFGYANQIENPLIINNITIPSGTTEVSIPHMYVPKSGTLSVWVNGIREFHIMEHFDGNKFYLPAPIEGNFVRDSDNNIVYDSNGEPERYGINISYIIEYPEQGKTDSMFNQILTKDNAVEGSPNVYKTDLSLYPGRVTVYVGGLRLPKENWTILDNYTILIKENPLIGLPANFPTEDIMDINGNIKTIQRQYSDEILVEVRQEFERVERTIFWEEVNNWDISINKYDLPLDILEANDEILIFINGLFTGLSTNIGYIKDRARGCLTITNPDVIENICTDPLYSFFMQNLEAYTAWKIKHNKSEYVPKIENQITFEWR